MPQQLVRSSLLDRFVTFKKGEASTSSQSRLVTIDYVKKSLIKDLENLFNSRHTALTPPRSYKEVNHSLFVYGLSDFTSKSPTDNVIKEIARDIQRTLTLFEPRLKNVTVLPPEKNTKKDKLKWWELSFRVIGTLVVQPVEEQIILDTYFDINRGQYVILR